MNIFDYTDDVLDTLSKDELNKILKNCDNLISALTRIDCSNHYLLNDSSNDTKINLNIDITYLNELVIKLDDIKRSILMCLDFINESEQSSSEFDYYIHQLNLSIKYNK